MDGFYYSPFLGHTWDAFGNTSAAIALSDAKLFTAAAAPPLNALLDAPLGGFQTFGSGLESGGIHTLTEADNAGLFQTLTMPIGATKLKFRVRLDQAGAGDFLEVRFGGYASLAVIDVDESSGGQWVEFVLPVGNLAGQEGTLIFRLVSRGSINAVVSVDGIALIISDDPDQDGLTTTEETEAGTDPLVFDTDGDGFSDSYELNVTATNPLRFDSDGDGVDDYLELAAGTNPLGNASVFSVKDLVENAGGSVSLW